MTGLARYDAFHIDDYTDVVAAARLRFANRIKQICGDSNVRLLIAPAKADTTTTTDLSANARTCTWDATIAARLDQAGLGYTQTFNGTSQKGTIPDAANLSFGNGTVDSPFSIVVLANVTNTAAYRTMLGKFGGTAREWTLDITGSDMLAMALFDQSASTPGANPQRISNAVITQGSVKLFAGVYTAATGGATAANDITLYQDASVIASTATNEVAYVAMENSAQDVEIGNFAASQWFSGSILMSLLVATALSSTQLTDIKTAVNEFFGLSL